MTKTNRFKFLTVFIASLAISVNSQSAFADLTGDFAPDNWTYAETNAGPLHSISTEQMSLTSANNGVDNTEASYSIKIPYGATSISFTFSYLNQDVAPSVMDQSEVIVNGVATEISGLDVPTGGTKSGIITVKGVGGQELSIVQKCNDCILGSGTTVVTDFRIASRNTFASDLLVASTGPTLTADSKTLTCTPGSYNLLLNGYSNQAGKPASIAYTLLVGGKRVSTLSSDSWKGMLRALFDTSDNSVTGSASLTSATWNVDVYEAGTAQCEVVAYQSSAVTTSLSNKK